MSDTERSEAKRRIASELSRKHDFPTGKPDDRLAYVLVDVTRTFLQAQEDSDAYDLLSKSKIADRVCDVFGRAEATVMNDIEVLLDENYLMKEDDRTVGPRGHSPVVPTDDTWKLYKEAKGEPLDFIRYSEFLSVPGNRRALAELAAAYHRDKDRCSVLDSNVPLIVEDAWIPETPIEISATFDEDEGLTEDPVLDWEGGVFDIGKTPFSDPDLLPVGRPHVDCIERSYPEKTLDDRESYRLVGVENAGNCRLKCGYGGYFDYVNTCETLLFEIAKAACDEKDGEEVPESSEAMAGSVPLREDLDITDFRTDGRCAVIGVNTLLVARDVPGIGDVFYLHDRKEAPGEGNDGSEKTTPIEAENTFHVVPAGTFQPAGKGSSRRRDFRIYSNFLREFAEELLGKDEFSDWVDTPEPFEITPLRDSGSKWNEVHQLVEDGNAKVFYLGFGVDPATTKPEILTVCVAKYEDLKDLPRFDEGFGEARTSQGFAKVEGAPLYSDLTEYNLRRYIKDEKMLPAGAACLHLFQKHKDRILESI